MIDRDDLKKAISKFKGSSFVVGPRRQNSIVIGWSTLDILEMKVVSHMESNSSEYAKAITTMLNSVPQLLEKIEELEAGQKTKRRRKTRTVRDE